MRKARSQFGLEAQEYFDRMRILDLEHGYSKISPAAPPWAREQHSSNEPEPPGNHRYHRVLTKGLNSRQLHIHRGFVALPDTEKAILWLQFGYWPENGKTATNSQRAKLAGMSVGSYRSKVQTAKGRWRESIKRVRACQFVTA